MIEVFPKDHNRIEEILETMLQYSPVVLKLLFRGERWDCVEWYAIAEIDDSDVGLATLAPTNESGEKGSHIIGIWVHPDYRGQGVGSELLYALAIESLQRYGHIATAEAATEAGWNCIQRAIEEGAPLNGIDSYLPGVVLP